MGDPPFADWGRMATTLKVLVLALAFAAIATAAGVTVGIDNADLKEAMAEAEDTDSALEWTRKHLRNWGGDFKKILKKMPPLALKDAVSTLRGLGILWDTQCLNPAWHPTKSSRFLPRLRIVSRQPSRMCTRHRPRRLLCAVPNSRILLKSSHTK